MVLTTFHPFMIDPLPPSQPGQSMKITYVNSKHTTATARRIRAVHHAVMMACWGVVVVVGKINETRAMANRAVETARHPTVAKNRAVMTVTGSTPMSLVAN
jgi:diphthamide synthase subunit DPH2